MKKITLFAALVMCASLAFAQVTKGTVGNGNFTNYASSTSVCYGLDFNNDGTCEFALKTGYDMGSGDEYANGSVEYVYSSSNNVLTNAETWDYFQLLSLGQTVSVTSSFNGQGDCFFEDYSAIGNTAYVGFRLKYTGIHYGYAKISLSGATVSWDAIYYNATASAAIAVGETATDVDNAAANHFIAAAMDGHQLNIVQDNDEVIDIYTVNGMKVESVKGTNVTVTLPAGGVYVLKSATSSTKILVK